MPGSLLLPETMEKNLMQELLRMALRGAEAESGMIAVSSGDESLLHIVAQVGLSENIKTLPCRKKGNECVSCYVMRTGKPVFIDKNQPLPLNLPYHRARDHCSACLPLRDPSGAIIGVISLNKKEGVFTKELRELLAVIATQTAIIIEEIRLRMEQENTFQILTTISRIFQSIIVSPTLKQAMHGVLSAALAVTGGSQGLMVKTTMPNLIVQTSSGLEPRMPKGRPEKELIHFFRENASEGKIIVLHSKDHMYSLVRSLFGEGFTTPITVCPVPSHGMGRKWGTLLLLSPILPDEKAKLGLRIVTNLAESSFENIRLMRHNQNLSIRQESMNLARELHDGLTQNLIALRMQAEYYADVASQNGGCIQYSEFSDYIINALTECINESREILTNLRKNKSSSSSLHFLVEKTIRKWFTGKPLKFSFRTTINEELISPRLKSVILKILHEAITNAGKHSNATNLAIRICRFQGWIYLFIRDNGSGFNLKEIRKKGGKKYGLRGMEEQVHYLHGRINIISRPGKGTKLQIGIPING